MSVSDRPLVAARSSHTSFGLAMLAAALLGVAIVLGVFDWPVCEVVFGSLIGSVVFGAAAWWGRCATRCRGRQRCLPAGAAVTRRVRPKARLVLLVVPLVVGFAWLADRWDLGAFFVPGQLAGTAAAYLAGAALVRRWERAHGRQVVVGRDGSGDPELYAAALERQTGSVQTSAIDGS